MENRSVPQEYRKKKLRSNKNCKEFVGEIKIKTKTNGFKRQTYRQTDRLKERNGKKEKGEKKKRKAEEKKRGRYTMITK